MSDHGASTGTGGAAAQPLLFDSLPETAPARRPARRSRATTVAEPIAVDSVREPAPRPMPPLAAAPAPAPAAPAAAPIPAPAAFDPAALTNPELRALVQGLTDQRLAYLVTEAAREVKRRLVPEEPDESAEAAEPNPVLLRAARQAVGELSGEDG